MLRLVFRRQLPSLDAVFWRSRRWAAPLPLRLGRSGGAAVEFAIIAPLFLMLLLGILLFGMYFGAAHGVAQLAADAARVSVAGINDAERITLAQSHVAAHARRYALIDPAKVSVIAGADDDDPQQFTVAVQFDASSLPIWFAPYLFERPDTVIERSASIRRGGY